MSKKKKKNSENIRSEYLAIAQYHNSMINSRFTIAGLYVTGMGFLAGLVFDDKSEWINRFIGSGLAFWLTICIWILELRSRSLYQNFVLRGIDIEHNYWQLKGKDWYSGFFSRQYKLPPIGDSDSGKIPERPDPDRPKLAWSKKHLSVWISKRISHSFGFDLLYGGSAFFWLILLILSICKLIFN